MIKEWLKNILKDPDEITVKAGRKPGAKNKRHPKQEIVQRWKATHPGASMRACSRDTGCSINTVRKYWE